MIRRNIERHYVGRVGWLRAAVLGANDGLLSTASLIIGVASAPSTHEGIVIAGVAGVIAGAMSMAAGEYVSVSSQRDAEQADLGREADELRRNPKGEETELAGIYVERGLDQDLARKVAIQLMAHDALKAHARDELGLSDALAAQPLQAALASAASFALGGAVPLAVALIVPAQFIIGSIAGSTLLMLAVLGATGAKIGGARIPAAVVRVTFWGALAMVVTAGLGHVFGTLV
jgi:VIT1/CCC1 family predicted Fe2+/Mn2+ transporter